MNDFDYNAIYYRVIDRDPENSRYNYDLEEMEIITTRIGVVKSAETHFEFDDMNGVAQWLYLGTKVRCLKIPVGSNILYNKSFSQGGCYRYSSDCVELLDILELEDFLGLLASNPHTQDVALHIAHHKFSGNVQLPTSLYSLNLTHCDFSQLKPPLHLHLLTIIADGEDWSWNFKHLSLMRLCLIGFEFENVQFPQCHEISLSSCIIFSSVFGDDTESMSCSHCLMSHVSFPREAKLFASACVLEDCVLPIQNNVSVGSISWQCELLNSRTHSKLKGTI